MHERQPSCFHMEAKNGTHFEQKTSRMLYPQKHLFLNFSIIAINMFPFFGGGVKVEVGVLSFVLVCTLKRKSLCCWLSNTWEENLSTTSLKRLVHKT